LHFRALHIKPPSKPRQLDGNIAKRRFKHLSLGAFFGGFVNERIVPRDYFLVKLSQLLEWGIFVPIRLPAILG
jgi:hypothetical protein